MSGTICYNCICIQSIKTIDDFIRFLYFVSKYIYEKIPFNSSLLCNHKA